MKNKKIKVLVLTSSFPKSKKDGVISFVKNQLLALKKYNQNLDFFVLAPNFLCEFEKNKISKNAKEKVEIFKTKNIANLFYNHFFI